MLCFLILTEVIIQGIGNTASGYLSLRFNTEGSYNTATGYQSLRLNTTGDNNTGIGYRALDNVTTGSNNTAIGYLSQVPDPTLDNQVRIGNTAITYAGVQVAWTITSDKRFKNNIENSNLGLEFINQLRPVSYYRNNDESNKTEYGFIAQELKEVLKNNDGENSGIVSEDSEGMLSVRYNDLLAPIVKAIQEQTEEIKSLKSENKALKLKLETIEKELKK